MKSWWVSILVVVGIFAFVSIPATASAAGPTEVAGSSSGSAGSSDPEGVHLTTVVSGNDIHYTITNVPPLVAARPPLIPAVQGFCNTVAADFLKAGGAALPVLLNSLSADSINYVELVRRITESGAVAGIHPLQYARNGMVTGQFDDVASGVYLVITVCNVQPTDPRNVQRELVSYTLAWVPPNLGSS
ncbi:hypothetical protein ACWDTD_03100 [Gordonia sp. NPDC003425]